MSTKNKKDNIEAELARAEKALQSAELLAKNQLYNDAVSRLYYFVFHHIRGLMFAKGFGLTPKHMKKLNGFFLYTS